MAFVSNDRRDLGAVKLGLLACLPVFYWKGKRERERDVDGRGEKGESAR